MTRTCAFGDCPMIRWYATVVLALGPVMGGHAVRAAQDWQGEITVEQGATRVTNPEVPLWPDDGSPRIELELEAVFGVLEGPEEAMLGSAPWVTVDDRGNVYLIDGKASELVAFAAGGEVLWRASQRGQGPADIQGPRDIDWNGEQLLAILNQSGTRLDLWNLDGRHVTSLPLAEAGINQSDAVQFVSADEVVLAANAGGGLMIYRLVDGPEWRLADELSPHATWLNEQPPLIRQMADVAFTGDALVVGSVGAHEFSAFGLDGGAPRWIRRAGTGFVPSRSDGLQAYRNFGRVAAPVRLADGKWLTWVHWVSNVADPDQVFDQMRQGATREDEWHVELDLYDAQGRWLTSLVWDHPAVPNIGSLETVGPDGALYTSALDPFPQVRRYRVHLRPGR